jgi:PBSX family phage terminase large subunit
MELADRVMRGGMPMPPTYDKQETFILSEAHHAAFVAGIGSGKSVAGAIRAHRAGMGWIGSARIQTPNLGMFTAPTEDMIRKASLRTFLEIASADVVGHNKNDKLITLRNGSEIYYASTQKPEHLRGPSIRWWWGDEAALYTPDVRKIMIGRLRQHGVRGYEWLTTTPRGRNYVWQTFVQDVPIDGRDDYLLIKARSRENTFQDVSIVEEWEREYTGDFAAQELDAEFIAFEGLIYGEFDRGRHVTTRLPSAFVRCVAGVDWGFANPGVILVLGIDGDGRMYLVREVYQRQTRIEEWAQIAVQLRNLWGIERFYCDPSSPDNIRKFDDAGLKTEAADNTVQTGIQMVKNRLVVRGDGQPRLAVSHEAVNSIDEFESYQWAVNRYGLRDEPVKAKDHAMDALRYACMGVDNPRLKPIKAEFRSYVR